MAAFSPLFNNNNNNNCSYVVQGVQVTAFHYLFPSYLLSLLSVSEQKERKLTKMVEAQVAAKAASLYRSLLRAHKKHLPVAMKELGDAYVKSEFRLHRKATQPEQIQRFMSEWETYLDQILVTARNQEHARLTDDLPKSERSVFQFGADLPSDVTLTDEQLGQLEQLKEEAAKAGK